MGDVLAWMEWVKFLSGKRGSEVGVGDGLAFVAGYNHFHNILSFFDVLPNFSFTIIETMGDYYL